MYIYTIGIYCRDFPKCTCSILNMHLSIHWCKHRIFMYMFFFINLDGMVFI